MLSMTGRSRDKFSKGNTHGYVKKKKKPPMTFNVVNLAKVFAISQAMEPIIFLTVSFALFYLADVLPGKQITNNN